MIYSCFESVAAFLLSSYREESLLLWKTLKGLCQPKTCRVQQGLPAGPNTLPFPRGQSSPTLPSFQLIWGPLSYQLTYLCAASVVPTCNIAWGQAADEHSSQHGISTQSMSLSHQLQRAPSSWALSGRGTMQSQIDRF